MKKNQTKPGSYPLIIITKWLAFTSILLILFLAVIGTDNQCMAESSSPGKDGDILVVDINSELLFALGEYHELTVEEKQKKVFVQDRLVPVIERIIAGFKKEHQNCLIVAARAGKSLEAVWTDKINRNIAQFESELMVRKKALEYELLRRKQRQMLFEIEQ